MEAHGFSPLTIRKNVFGINPGTTRARANAIRRHNVDGGSASRPLISSAFMANPPLALAHTHHRASFGASQPGDTLQGISKVTRICVSDLTPAFKRLVGRSDPARGSPEPPTVDSLLFTMRLGPGPLAPTITCRSTPEAGLLGPAFHHHPRALPKGDLLLGFAATAV